MRSWMNRVTQPEQAIEGPGVLETIGAGFSRENLFVNALDAIGSDAPEKIDVNYRYRQHEAALTDGIPERYHPEIAKQLSLEDAEYVRGNILKDLEDQEIIQRAGYGGIAASLLGGIVSPENYIPWVGQAAYANKVNRLQNILRTGASAAATNAAAEAALVAGDYTKDGEDIIYAATFGFALGGALGAIRRNPAPDELPTTVGETAEPGPIPSGTGPSPLPPKPEYVAPQVMGPPTPAIKTRTINVSTGQPAVRRGGPIEMDERIRAEEFLEAFPKMRVLPSDSNATLARQEVRSRQEVRTALSHLDPEANIGSDIEEAIKEAYEYAGYVPMGRRTATVEERVAGTWDDLTKAMEEASAKLRADLDEALIRDAELQRGTPLGRAAQADGFGDAGAMQARGYDPQLVETSLTEDEIIESATQWSRAERVDERLKADVTNTAAVKSKILSSDYTRLINSPSKVAQRLAYELLEGGTGTLRRNKTAAMYKDMYERRLLSKGLIPLNDQYAAWAKAKGLNFWKRNFFTSGYETFYNEVRLVMENRRHGRVIDASDQAIEAADRIDDMMAEALEIGQRSGWEAMQGIPRQPGYIPLTWNGTSILRVGKQKSINLIAQGYRSIGMDADTAQEIAAAVVKRSLDGTAGVDTDISGLLAKDKRGQLAVALEGMGMSQEKINALLKNLDKAEQQAGPGFTKGRTNIDLTVADPDGTALIDLVDNDLNAILSRYSREVAGRSALAKKGIKSDGDWNRMKNAALKENERVRGLSDGDDKLSEHLDDIKSYFTASPIAGGINANVRRVQQLATISSLGMVGAAQLAELGTVVGRMGLKAAARNIPAAKEVATLAKSRELSGDVLDELRPLLGDFDYDHLLYRPDIQIDDKVSGAVDAKNWVGILDKGLGRGNTLLGYASGMNTVRHFEHRMAARMMIDRFSRIALDGVDKRGARLEDTGLYGADLDQVTAQIRRHAVRDANGTVTSLNLARWPESVAETFAMAINRHTAQVVQRQLAGETSNWMHKSIGSLLTQFRHFPIVAFEKQLLRNLRYHDQSFYTTLLYGFAVSYGVQTIRAGLSGNELEQEDLIKQTVNYMGMASVLPEVGTLANQLGLAPDILNTRKLGHTGTRPDEFDIIDYVPAAGQINKTVRAAATVGQGAASLVGLADTPTESDARAAFMALPFATTIFGKQLMQLMIDD